jgi:hypothetical protein
VRGRWCGIGFAEKSTGDIMNTADPKRQPSLNPPPAERNTPTATPPHDAAADEEPHEGATEDQVGDRTGPGAGYDEMAGRKPDRRD